MKSLESPAYIRERKARVRKGIKILDKAYPTWFKRISFAKLEMQDCDNCILGQLYGSIWKADIKLQLNGSWAECGFAGDCVKPFWIKAIQAKRKKAKAA